MRNHPTRNRSAFTLIELMVSIALVLLLLVGISKVFSLTTETVATNQNLSTIIRDARNFQAAAAKDFASLASPASGTSPAPFFVIQSERYAAFRDRKDELSDRDYTAVINSGGAATDDAILTVDLDGNNVEGEGTVPGEQISRLKYNGFRNYRVDQLQFFVRGNFRRQSGNPGTYMAPMSAKEALVWYGHLKRNTTAPPAPPDFSDDRPLGFYKASNAYTSSTNPLNFYASQWIFGRYQILLKDPTPSTVTPTRLVILDDNGVEQQFVGTAAATGPAPLSMNSQLYTNVGTSPTPVNPSPLIQWSCVDLAGTSIQAYRARFTTYTSTNPPPDWWDQSNLCFRYQGNPAVTKPMTSWAASRSVPPMIPGCTNFMIEYAGDFIAQDNVPSSGTYGNITNVCGYKSRNKTTHVVAQYGGTTDGVIDYYLDPRDQTKRIRWYGFPRDVGHYRTANAETDTPDGVIEGWGNQASWPGGTGRIPARMPDVVPLRDVMEEWVRLQGTINTSTDDYGGAPFEMQLCSNDVGGTKLANKFDYMATAFGFQSRYVCAWGPDSGTAPMPKMIRIIMTIDDPSGRLAEGQTFEFVYNLP